MIKAKDLRIGNLLQNERGDHRIVQAIGKDDVLTGLVWEMTENLNPIPLTEDILKKSGFVWENVFDCVVADWKLGDNFELTSSSYVEEGEWKTDFVFNYWNCQRDASKMQVEVKYVHQLQNLVYLMTGTELEVVF